MRHTIKWLIVLIICCFVFIGSHWQIEIAVINICNGWPFGFLFTWIVVDNWAAKDFFYLLAFVSFICACVASYYIGYNHPFKHELKKA